MATTTMGKNRLLGKAAMNWATGCTTSAHLAFSPTTTPIGTQIRLASTIRTRTRTRVRPPRPTTPNASTGLTSEPM
jgi:hypothetical protein